jgi:hypothetical protein
MPGYYYRLHSGKTGWKSGDDSCRSVMAMYDVGAGTPKRFVQATHLMKKRGRMMENYLKAFGPQLFAEYANHIEAVD